MPRSSLFRVSFPVLSGALLLFGGPFDQAAAQRVRLSLDVPAVTESDTDRFASVGVTLTERGEVLDALETVRCYPYWLGYNGLADRDDAWVAAGDSPSLADRPPSPIGGWIYMNLDGMGGGIGQVHSLAVAGDEFVEGDEDLLLNVYQEVDCSAGDAPPPAPRAGTVVASLSLSIVDDDRLPPEASFVDSTTVEETDVDQVAIVSITLSERADVSLCYPYRVEYAASTATVADAWLVAGVGDSTPVDSGWFVVGPGSDRGVSSNLFVVGDDLAETDERLLLTLYPAVPLLVGDRSCSVVGAPRGRVAVTIVDDDAAVVFEQVDVLYSETGSLIEGSAGDVSPVEVQAVLSRVLVGAVTVTYGSLARGSARPHAPQQDFEALPETSVRVPPGRRALLLSVGAIIGDSRPEPDEDFWLWLEIDGLPSTRVYQRVVIRDDDVAADVSLSLEIQGAADFAVTEGDPAGGPGCAGEWLCLPVVFSLEARASVDLLLELRTYPGSAAPGVDYAPLDATLVRIPAGDLVSTGGDPPLRLRVRRDYLVEPDENFYLAAYQKHPNGESLASFHTVRILDDDGGAPGAGGRVWFGHPRDEFACPDPSSAPYALAEPPGQGSLAVHSLRVLARVLGGDDADDLRCVAFDPGKPVDYAYTLESVTALVGVDVLAPRGESAGVLRFVGGSADLSLAVVGDRVPEPLERFRLTLFSGAGAVALFDLQVADYDTFAEVAAAEAAAGVRVARVVAAEVSDALADRFACARSGACGRGDAPVGAPLWPGGAPPPGLASLLSRAAGGVSQAAGVPARLSPARSPSVARSVLAGRLLDGVGYQGDPATWRRRGSSRPSGWTAWFRSTYRQAVDRASSGRALDTSALFLTGGLDRVVGPLHVGALYSRVFVSERSDPHHALHAHLPDLPAVASAWHVVAPYAGYVPHSRLRTWVSFGTAWGGSSDPASLAVTPLDAVRFRQAGASVSVLALPRLVVDAEGDLFVSEAFGRTARPASGDGASVDLGEARRRRLALRVGVPLARYGSPSSRVVVRLVRRWDAGGDIDWLWTGLAVPELGPGDVVASDLSVEYRYAPSASRFSAQLAAGLHVQPELPVVPGQPLFVPESVRRTLSGSFDWGSGRRGAGWSASVRPAYGHPVALLPAWWSGGGLPLALYGVSPSPLLDAHVRYGFASGAHLAVAASHVLTSPVPGAGLPAAGRLSVVYGRVW